MFAHPGDPYPGDDDVVRGVTLFQHGDWDLSEALAPKFSLDSEHVCHAEFLDGNLPTFAGWGEGFFDVEGDCSMATAVALAEREVVDEASGAFSDAFQAPAVPSDPLSAPDASTSLQLPWLEPAVAGNRLLATLRAQHGVQVVKIRPQKFTLKANACLSGGGSCGLKVFVYAARDRGNAMPDSLAPAATGAVVELQRRSGDALAFHAVFELCSRALAESDRSLDAACNLEDCLWKAPPLPAVPQEASAPDMVSPPLAAVAMAQTEGAGDSARTEADRDLEDVAGAVLALAEWEEEAIAQLCLPEARTGIERLLLAESFRVAYPAARALACLARSVASEPAAVPWLERVAGELLKARQDSDAIRIQLEQALAHLRGAGGEQQLRQSSCREVHRAANSVKHAHAGGLPQEFAASTTFAAYAYA
eukprot:TRINITY_DN56545_c0_g1_i1.p1 TRINITY_DN56545_c0_g1~~TRINITY_DN56545_c0_g1_i1.p1  ORF type:complete len:421 (-),score=101.38 TRINITY_DN56545_c0_g1_i1:148-1410(-)